MTYTPTVWHDNTAPAIDAAQLTRIEAGVLALYDAAFLVDAPTGVSATDSANIQAGIDAGGLIQLQQGTYICNVLIKTGAYLVGAGINKTILKAPNSSSAAVITVPNFATLTGTNSNSGEKQFAIRDLSVDGNRDNGGTGRGIALYGYYYNVDNIHISECGSDGFYSEWGTGGTVAEGMEAVVGVVHTHDNTGDGFVFAGPHDSQVSEVMTWYNGNTPSPNAQGGNGFWTKANATGTLFDRCHAYGPHNNAWKLEGTAHLNGCVGEGGAVQLLILANDSSIMGGVYYASGAVATQVGVEIGSTGGGAVAVSGCHIDTKITNCTGGSLKFTNSNGLNIIRLSGYQTTGSHTSGTPNAADRLDLHFAGQTRAINTAASLQQSYGKRTMEIGAGANAFLLRNDGADQINVNTSTKRLELVSGYQIHGYAGSYSSRSYLIEATNGHITIPGGTAPTVAAGSAAGGSPPAPVATNCSDSRGVISFGTGTSPSAGQQVTVTFGASYNGLSINPVVVLTPRNAAAAALNLYTVTLSGITSVAIHATTAPAASQANTVYEFGYHVIG